MGTGYFVKPVNPFPKEIRILIIKKLPVGPIMANCFILGCEETKKAAVIDPGDETDKILRTLANEGLTVEQLINTHCHFDHAGGNKKMRDATGAPLVLHALEIPVLNHLAASAARWGLSTDDSPAPDRTVEDNDTISFGNIALTVIHTPGHSPGGISLYTNGYLFVGDTLFAGSIGRTDFPGGDHQTLLTSIREKLFPLGDDVQVYTGHGPETTIGTEKRTNPFVRMN